MEEIRIVDTTLRDGDISLWAYGMTTGMMLPALCHMDEAGFDSMEFFLSLRFKKFVREHKEDPWDWLRLGTKEVTKTRLRYHGGAAGHHKAVVLAGGRRWCVACS
jgi:oxaloacetate decarboxylase alpha subunit